MNAAADTKSIDAGIGISRVASITSSSANPPQPGEPITRSPGRNCVTASPTAVTSPAISPPGENGSDGLNWYLFSISSRSGKLTPTPLTATSTSPRPGVGDGTSSTTSVSGGPNALQRTALTRAP